MTEYYFIIMLSIAGVGILSALVKSRHFIRLLIINALCGVAALLAVYFVGGIIGSALPINVLTISVSAAGGAAGVVFLLLFNAMCAA